MKHRIKNSTAGSPKGETEMVETIPIEMMESSPDDKLSVIYAINNHIYFYREINEESAALFNKTITEIYYDLIQAMLSSGLTNPIIEVHINSPGGDVFAAVAIVKKIEEIKKGFGAIPIPVKVITHAEGQSSSAGTLMSIVGNERVMSEYSVMLIHEVLGGILGNKDEVEVYSTNMKLLSSITRKIYKANSKLTDEDLDKIMKDDLLFDAETCLRYGLVDKIV